METSAREKRERIIAHAYAQLALDTPGAPQAPYDELVKGILQGISEVRQRNLHYLAKLPPEERAAALEELDDFEFGSIRTVKK